MNFYVVFCLTKNISRKHLKRFTNRKCISYMDKTFYFRRTTVSKTTRMYK